MHIPIWQMGKLKLKDKQCPRVGIDSPVCHLPSAHPSIPTRWPQQAASLALVGTGGAHCFSLSCLFWEILRLGTESGAAVAERGAATSCRSCGRPALSSRPILGKAACGGALRDRRESARRNAQDALFPLCAPRTNVLGPGRGGA